MSDFANDPTIRRVRALLKKAESLAKMGDLNSDTEAEACNEMAAKLIAKYGIDQALLAERGEIKDVIINKLIELTGDYIIDKRVLLNNIVKALGAQAIFLRARRPGTVQSYKLTAHVFAYETDMDRIEFLFDLLQPQMFLGAVAAQVPYGENARSFRKSWMSGFVSAIAGRLKRTHKEAAAEAGVGTDLVLFDRSSAVELEYNLIHDPKSVVMAGARRLSGSGRSQGYAAGRRANIGNTVGGGRKTLTG